MKTENDKVAEGEIIFQEACEKARKASLVTLYDELSQLEREEMLSGEGYLGLTDNMVIHAFRSVFYERLKKLDELENAVDITL